MKTQNLIRRQRGLAIVETVITLPLLLFVMLAAAEFTNAFVQHTTLTKLVRDGARHAAEHAIPAGLGIVNLTAALQTEVENVVVYGNKDGIASPLVSGPLVSGLDVSDVTVTDVGGDNIEVNVSFPYSGILGSVLPSFGYGSNTSLLFTMDATVTMRAI